MAEIGLKDVFDFFKAILPALFMLIALHYLVGGYFRDKEKRDKVKAVRDNQKMITPLRLQAYERLVLFLERISAESLLMRTTPAAKTCEMLQIELLQMVQAEYEHNLSQQLYVSIEAWKAVVSAKKYTVSLINNAAKDLDSKAPSLVLSRKIIELTMSLDQSITEKAIREIKTELHQIF
jgi:hypothetical protein